MRRKAASWGKKPSNESCYPIAYGVCLNKDNLWCHILSSQIFKSSNRRMGRGVNFLTITCPNWEGSGKATSEHVSSACGLFRAKRQLRPGRHRKSFSLPFYLPKKIYIEGTVPGRQLWPKITFYMGKMYLHGAANVCLWNVCSSQLPVNCLPPLWDLISLSLSG